jgi:hypothetical protein
MAVSPRVVQLDVTYKGHSQLCMFGGTVPWSGALHLWFAPTVIAIQIIFSQFSRYKWKSASVCTLTWACKEFLHCSFDDHLLPQNYSIITFFCPFGDQLEYLHHNLRSHRKWQKETQYLRLSWGQPVTGQHTYKGLVFQVEGLDTRLNKLRGPSSASELYWLSDLHLSAKFNANFCG